MVANLLFEYSRSSIVSLDFENEVEEDWKIILGVRNDISPQFLTDATVKLFRPCAIKAVGIRISDRAIHQILKIVERYAAGYASGVLGIALNRWYDCLTDLSFFGCLCVRLTEVPEILLRKPGWRE